MGPLQLRSGKAASTPRRRWVRRSFNGAAPIKERKGATPPRRVGGRRACFNGAAPIKERKAATDCSAAWVWLASMGPLQLRSGKHVVAAPVHDQPLGFNGAAPIKERKAAAALAASAASSASMGPLQLRSGKPGAGIGLTWASARF